jgi:adenylate cyclase
MDGVEFHAHFLDGILQNRYMKAYNITNGIFIIVLFFLVLISVTIYYLFSSRYVSIGIAIGITLWIIWMSRYAYFVHGIVLEIFPILLAGSMLSFPFSFIYRFFIVDREKRMLRSAFSHYVDPELVREISDASSTIKL